MNTTVYLMRHSEPLKPININNNDSFQLQNEKWVLTTKGENLAKEKSSSKEFSDIDVVITSNYTRAVATAKYFTDDKILVDENFGERKFGINNRDGLPKDYNQKQFNDFNYKLPNGESINEVINREYESLINILHKYIGKKILIVGHGTAISSLLTKWCNIDRDMNYTFNNWLFFKGKLDYLETFKLIFDSKDNLINVENIN